MTGWESILSFICSSCESPSSSFLIFHFLVAHFQSKTMKSDSITEHNFITTEYGSSLFIFRSIFSLCLKTSRFCLIISLNQNRVRHSKLLEEGSFRGKTADFLYMYIFGGFILVVRNFYSPSVFPSPWSQFSIIFLKLFFIFSNLSPAKTFIFRVSPILTILLRSFREFSLNFLCSWSWPSVTPHLTFLILESCF